jgi:hypothetical protein
MNRCRTISAWQLSRSPKDEKHVVFYTKDKGLFALNRARGTRKHSFKLFLFIAIRNLNAFSQISSRFFVFFI